MQDNLYTREQAREKLISGINRCKEAVGGTMGSAGGNSIIEAIENPGFLNTNDGWSILNAIKFADPLEDLGRKILLEAVSRANKQSGDGSSGTTVLTSAIINEGLKHIGEASVIEIKKSLEDCIPFIEQSIKDQAKEVTVDNVKDVCSISAEDEKIGALIQEIYQKIGRDGIIYWDISKTTEDTYTIGSGITISGAGYVSPYMCDIDEKTGQFLNVARWKNPKILLTKQKITGAIEFNDLFSALFEKDVKEVVIFCNEIEAPVIADLIKTRAMRGFKTVVVKMPVLWNDWWFEDIARISGAKVIDPVLGFSLKNAKPEDLGEVGNIIISKDDTFIDGIKDVTEYAKQLEAEGTDDAKLRASRLNTKTARLFVGAHSESALSYKRLKVEDAISAGYQALHGGVVAGGGVCLHSVSKTLPDTVGGNILKKALQAPLRQILSNAGFIPYTRDEKKWYQNYSRHPYLKIDGADFEDNRGIDTRTRSFVNMFDANIVDPAQIIINSVKNAISVSASALTANTVVLLQREDERSANPMIMR